MTEWDSEQVNKKKIATPIEKGAAAELYVQSLLLHNGIIAYRSPVPDSIDDLLVDIGDKKYLKCQVKVMNPRTGTGSDRLALCSRSKGHKKGWRRYSSNDIDVMIGVDIGKGDIYIVSLSILDDLGYKRSISCTKLEEMGCKNNLLFFDDISEYNHKE